MERSQFFGAPLAIALMRQKMSGARAPAHFFLKSAARARAHPKNERRSPLRYQNATFFTVTFLIVGNFTTIVGYRIHLLIHYQRVISRTKQFYSNHVQYTQQKTRQDRCKCSK